MARHRQRRTGDLDLEWRDVDPANALVAPSPRYEPAIATDLLRGRIVLFGSTSLTPTALTAMQDTWIWGR